MSNISYECDVTEFHIIPPKENETVVFVLQNESLIINFCGTSENVIMQSEIEKKSAIELANLILVKYK